VGLLLWDVVKVVSTASCEPTSGPALPVRTGSSLRGPERLPNDRKHARVPAHTDMATFDFDVLKVPALGSLDAILPGDNRCGDLRLSRRNLRESLHLLLRTLAH
jgi:hypothetical protein